MGVSVRIGCTDDGNTHIEDVRELEIFHNGTWYTVGFINRGITIRINKEFFMYKRGSTVRLEIDK